MTKILYVEDEPFLAKIVKETLESKNYEVSHVSDGADALGAYKDGSFNICLLDIMLPNQNGYQIAKDIRAINQQIPILFLTAKNQTEDLVEGFKVGGNDYIKKPFSMEELMVRIENLLSLSKIKSSNNNVFEINMNYKFFPNKYELHATEKIYELSHKETIILKLLCENQNQIIERKKILMEAWGDDSYYNSRNLDVYITKLRSYFKPDPEINLKTLKGVGYSFNIA